MSVVRRAVLGLGSNLGDRRANLEAATGGIAAELGIELIARSPIYETAPVGGLPQGDYLNAAVLVRTALGASELVARALAVEEKLGRTRPAGLRDAPRTIDVDVLWIEGESFDDGQVRVPHPRLEGRAFALKPLLDVAPDACDPETGRAYADLPAANESLAISQA